MTTLLATSSSDPLEAYAALASRLDAVGHRFRFAFCLRALGRFTLVVVPVIVACLFIAGFWSLPTAGNISLIALMALTLIGGYLLFLHRPLFVRPSYAELARLIEFHGRTAKADLPVDNALINAVLLAQDYQTAQAAGSAARGSNAWIPHVLNEANNATQSLPLERSVPWRQPRNAWVVAALACLTCAIVMSLWPAPFAHGFAVLTAPTRFVPHQGAVKIISVAPGNDTAIAGQPILFSVSVKVPEQRAIAVQLSLFPAHGRPSTVTMAAVGQNNTQYNWQMTATDDLDYSITAGDTESERFHITVLPDIRLNDFRMEAIPPAYTGRDKISLALPGKDATAAKGTLDVPFGSQMTVSASLSGPAKEVMLDVAGTGKDSGPLPMAAGAGGFSATFPATDARHFTLRINDGAGQTLKQFPDASAPGTAATDQEFFSISVIPDNPPTITLTNPGRDMDAKPGDKIALEAQATDDYGLTQIRLEIAHNADQDFTAIQSWPVGKGPDGKPARAITIRYTLDLSKDAYKLGDTLRYRFVAVDNRNLTNIDLNLGLQTTLGQIFTISFNDQAALAIASGKLWEELRVKLSAILDHQIALRKQANGLVAGMPVEDIHKTISPIADGQKSVRTDLTDLAKKFPFEPSMKLVQKSLEVLSVGDASDAVDRGADIMLLSDSKSLVPLATRLRQNQSRIIDVLQTLLAIIAADQEKLAQTGDAQGGDLPSNAKDAWKKLDDQLKNFEKEQQGVIDATADLAKKPKDQFGADDEKKLADQRAIEDKWEKFLNERLADMSKLAEQDQANASLLDEVVQMKVELATAKNALDQKAAEVATPLEENSLENATALDTHIERWLQQQPDRTNWQMEDPVTQNDPKMAELPQQLQDMVGDLMDKEEDLTQDMESLASKFADSLNKGEGWDAADGPISNMSAQGVTGNQLPKDMEIQGRSGEGREGRSSGEMVGSTAEGKEGRDTPTRLTNDPFSNSQVQDSSTLPAGGATGGGKKGQLGGAGLEGPAPQDDPNITQRLAGQQADIRNEAERVNLQMTAAGMDNFKLLESNAYLKKSEDALKQFHYQTALYYQEQAVQSLNTAKVLAAGEVHVITDSSPTASEKTQKDIDAALNGPMPKGYGDPVKAYFEKLADQ